jgi:hypothetical protein
VVAVESAVWVLLRYLYSTGIKLSVAGSLLIFEYISALPRNLLHQGRGGRCALSRPTQPCAPQHSRGGEGKGREACRHHTVVVAALLPPPTVAWPSRLARSTSARSRASSWSADGGGAAGSG